MKILYLVRHAKSSWDHPELSDFDRPLNKRGHKDAPFMARQIKAKGAAPELLISSPAARAFTTARYFAEVLGIPEDAIQVEAGLYEAAAKDIIRIIKGIQKTVNTVMLFGHNPGITNCANQLAKKSVDNIVTTGVYCIKFDTDNWIDLDKITGKFIFYDYPKKYK